jgi:hypothetical protein
LDVSFVVIVFAPSTSGHPYTGALPISGASPSITACTAA